MAEPGELTGTAAAAADDPIDRGYAWWRLAVSVVLGSVGSVGFWAVVVVMPAVQTEFAVGRGSASIPFTLTMIGFALGNVLIGRFVDRHGIVRPVIYASLALGGGFAAAAATDEIWQFSLLQGVLIGIGTGATFGPLMADVSHWFRRYRGIAVATCACGNYLGGAVWPVVLEAITAGEGWRAAYVVTGIVCVATMIPLGLLLRRPSPDSYAVPAHGPAPGARMPRPIGMSPAQLQILLVIAGIGCCVAMSMPQVHIVAYCIDLGYGPARGAEMLALMLGAGIFSRLASGILADRIGGAPTLLIGSVLQLVALIFFLPFDGLMPLYVVSFLFGLAQGGIVPCYAIIVREYMPAREAGQRVGIVIMATVLGMALGGWMSGWIYDVTGTYFAAFVNGIGWNLINLSAILFLLWRSRGPRLAPAI